MNYLQNTVNDHLQMKNLIVLSTEAYKSFMTFQLSQALQNPEGETSW